MRRTRASTRPAASLPACGCEPPDAATTVRVQDGKTLTTNGPFVAIKEALGGYLIYEADDLDAAIDLAARIPAARWAAPWRCARSRRGESSSSRSSATSRGRVLASLIGFLGDFDLAEEAAQEAFAIAAERWPRDGSPESTRVARDDGTQPRRSTASAAIARSRRSSACSTCRRPLRQHGRDHHFRRAARAHLNVLHPALSLEGQVALTLRSLGGLDVRKRSPAPSSYPTRRWQSGSSERGGRSRRRASLSVYRRLICCPTDSQPCSRSCI